MNSIHEPGSRRMSKNRLRNRTESNRAKNRLSAMSAQPTDPTVRPGRAPCRALRAPRLPAARPCRPAPARPLRPARRAPAACARMPPLPRAPMPPATARPRAPHAPTPRACARASVHLPPARPTAPLRAQRSAQRSARLPYAQWAVAHFRFCIFFFSFLSATGKYQKNIFIYFLSFSSTPINLLKFISSILFFFPNKLNKLLKFILFIFLFQFTHCKLQGLFSNMPMCYLPKHTNIQHVIHTKHIHTTIH